MTGNDNFFAFMQILFCKFGVLAQRFDVVPVGNVFFAIVTVTDSPRCGQTGLSPYSAVNS